MKLFFDTEFTGLHKGTTLISIGLISEDNREFYAEFTDYDKTQCNDWINENVIANLKFKTPSVGEDNYYVATRDKHNPKENDLHSMYSVEMQGNKQQVKEELTKWLSQFDKVELVSDVCHYDMVLFVDIFGTAFDLPSNVSPACYDINPDISFYYQVTQQEAFDMNREDIIFEETGYEIQGDKHNSLYNAKVIKELYEIV